MSRCASNLTRPGFTLVEVAVCLLVLSVLTAIASVSLRGIKANMSLEDVADRLAMWDRMAREHARNTGREGQLIIDLSRQELVLPRGESNSRWSLPASCRIERVQVAGEAPAQRQVMIRYSSRGHSRSWAIVLQGPHAQQRLLVAGLSGQVQALQTQEQLDAAVAELEKQGTDAD